MPWSVACGDHLWAIAEHVVGEARGRRPTDAEVARYWRQVVANLRLPPP